MTNVTDIALELLISRDERKDIDKRQQKLNVYSPVLCGLKTS
jgi:hypothetical protein